ncbi:MAG: LuxR C-terminal-related transcriptional regulator [Muribaculaceae bacterium]|nr:LuxR C-terminal-related transcriptional regulator [Muribaculaceae bacterium]
MKTVIYFLLLIIASGIMFSCSRSMSEYDKEIGEAEKLMQTNSDSALVILENIDPSDLKADSIRAKLIYLKAYGHMKQNRSMIADSLIQYAHDYYRGKDMVRDVRSGIAYAWYKFWVGDTRGAISMLDSLTNLKNVPDSIMVQTLRVRTLLGASEYHGKELLPLAKRLISLEKDSLRKLEAKYMLAAGYEYSNMADSALYILDELIDYARKSNRGKTQFALEIERAQLLTEAGKPDESEALIEEIFQKAGRQNGGADLLHFQQAINALSRGDLHLTARHLAMADSLAMELRGEEDAHYRSYTNLLHAILDYKNTGKITLAHINGLNNRQNERFNRIKASQWESERGALIQQGRALELKAANERKTVVILVIVLVALMSIGFASWIIFIRRERERENEERIEALQKMVEEYKSAPAAQEQGHPESAALRSAMLRQLGIIKMVAEAPTEQNQEMLRRISSIDGDTNGELVDWTSVYEIIDNLYSGFYTKLHSNYGNLLSRKEEQIIVLMIAGFSTKEISVISGHTTSTIYVRKTAIRKKLGVPEKEDIVHFLQNQYQH